MILDTDEAYDEGYKAFQDGEDENPYQELADAWDEGFFDAEEEEKSLPEGEPKPGDMVQLTGNGAFQCETAHECPRCGTMIPVGWWLEPLFIDREAGIASETIVCSAACKAREFSPFVQ